MKQVLLPDIELCLDRAIAEGRRQRAAATFREATARRLERYRRLHQAAVMCSCLAATVALFHSCTPVPDARYTRSDRGHQELVDSANFYIALL